MRKAKAPAALPAVFANIRSPDEVERFLKVILSSKEVENLGKRWRAFQMLLEGKTQRSVSKALPISIATVSRAANVIKSERALLERLNSGGTILRRRTKK